MAYMPPRQELDGRLQMDQDGTKTVVGHAVEAYEYKTGKSFYVRWELYEQDGETPIKEPGGKHRDIIDYVPTDMRHFRFLQTVDALSPEISKGGCEFSPKTHWEGRKAILRIEYDKEAEASGNRPRLRVRTVSSLKSSKSGGKTSTPPPVSAPAPAPTQAVPDNPF